MQAKTSLDTIRIQLEELEIRKFQLEVKRQEIQLSKDQVERDTVNRDIAKRRLDETKVYSPIDGVVVDKQVQIGQIISSGITNIGGGTTIMTVSDLSRIFVYASVDESDIGKVEVGQKADITVDAFPEARFTGEVQIISPQGVNESNVVTFELKIEVISDNKTLLKPEMTANVEIVAAQKEEVAVASLRCGDSEGQGSTGAPRLKNGAIAGRDDRAKRGINDFINVENRFPASNWATRVVLHEITPVSQWNGGPPPPP